MPARFSVRVSFLRSFSLLFSARHFIRFLLSLFCLPPSVLPGTFSVRILVASLQSRWLLCPHPCRQPQSCWLLCPQPCRSPHSACPLLRRFLSLVSLVSPATLSAIRPPAAFSVPKSRLERFVPGFPYGTVDFSALPRTESVSGFSRFILDDRKISLYLEVSYTYLSLSICRKRCLLRLPFSTSWG